MVSMRLGISTRCPSHRRRTSYFFELGFEFQSHVSLQISFCFDKTRRESQHKCEANAKYRSCKSCGNNKKMGWMKNDVRSSRECQNMSGKKLQKLDHVELIKSMKATRKELKIEPPLRARLQLAYLRVRAGIRTKQFGKVAQLLRVWVLPGDALVKYETMCFAALVKLCTGGMEAVLCEDLCGAFFCDELQALQDEEYGEGTPPLADLARAILQEEANIPNSMEEDMKQLAPNMVAAFYSVTRSRQVVVAVSYPQPGLFESTYADVERLCGEDLDDEDDAVHPHVQEFLGTFKISQMWQEKLAAYWDAAKKDDKWFAAYKDMYEKVVMLKDLDAPFLEVFPLKMIEMA